MQLGQEERARAPASARTWGTYLRDHGLSVHGRRKRDVSLACVCFAPGAQRSAMLVQCRICSSLAIRLRARVLLGQHSEAHRTPCPVASEQCEGWRCLGSAGRHICLGGSCRGDDGPAGGRSGATSMLLSGCTQRHTECHWRRIADASCVLPWAYEQPQV